MNTKSLGGCLMLFLVTPLWYYLIYRILVAINADSLLWGVFWAYVPLNFVLRFVLQVFVPAKEETP